MQANPQQVRELFLHAVGKLPPEEWDGFVAKACHEDAELEQQVRYLLQVHREAGNFLETPAVPGVIEELAGQAFARAAQTEPVGGDVEDISLEFLTPSQFPGSLGRLDHYEILEVVGKGGMGVVLRARDTKLQRVVAIKALAAPLAASGTARQRFAREARAAAAVRDDHVIDIYAVCDDAPVPYLVMECIDGCNLDA